MRRLSAVLVCAIASLVVAATSGAAAGAAATGVVKWRFQVSGQYVLHPPAVGP